MTSSLFRLSGELRNRIYEYIFTDPSPFALRYREYTLENTNWQSLLVDSNGRLFNVLKYTCRQLRAETQGLELKYNPLTIHAEQDDDGFGPAWLFQRFLDKTTPRDFDRLTTINIYCAAGGADFPVDMRGYASFCKMYPRVTVKHYDALFNYSGCVQDIESCGRIQDWSIGDRDTVVYYVGDFMRRALQIIKFYRGKKWSTQDWDSFAYMFDQEDMDAHAIQWRGDDDEIRDLQTPNFRLWPNETHVDSMFRFAAEHWDDCYQRNGQLRDAWIHMFEQWLKKGL